MVRAVEGLRMPAIHVPLVRKKGANSRPKRMAEEWQGSKYELTFIEMRYAKFKSALQAVRLGHSIGHRCTNFQTSSLVWINSISMSFAISLISLKVFTGT